MFVIEFVKSTTESQIMYVSIRNILEIWNILHYLEIYYVMPISYLEGEYGGGGWCWRVLTGNPGMTTVCSTPKIGSTPPPIEVETAPVKCVCWTIPLIFEGDPRPCLPWLFPSIPNDSSLKLRKSKSCLSKMFKTKLIKLSIDQFAKNRMLLLHTFVCV